MAEPWCDLKVAYGIDNEDCFEQWLSATRYGKGLLPQGWELCETDASGARMVAVFRVEGPLREDDGRAVAELLAQHGGYKPSVATPSAPNPQPPASNESPARGGRQG